ncbi:hypothetical protein CDD83_800 [Cordyceps sp. RAO-2017]|nr:hypothetical protein CDD83_800 [Cordyceps sp. RAO-2017]
MASEQAPQMIRTVIQPDPNSTALALTLAPLPRPAPEDADAHLIQVKATSPCLNELTWEVNFPDLFPPDRERVPCTECAGVVVRAPAGGASGFKPGDEVYFRLNAWQRGCLSEYTLAPTFELALKPKACSSTAAWTRTA